MKPINVSINLPPSIWFAIGTLFFLTANDCMGGSPRWDFMFQDDYVVDVHHLDVVWYNKSYVTVHHCEMFKYNRTFKRVLRASGILHKELGTDLTLAVTHFKLLSNTYKFFPYTVTIQACQEYERNSFLAKDIIKNYTNLKPCPQKPGHIYAHDVIIDDRRLPPLVPSGNYKVHFEGFHKTDKLFVADLFLAITYKSKLENETYTGRRSPSDKMVKPH